MGEDVAVVLLSGGVDSTVCLYLARRAYRVEALTVDYGQRHGTEVIVSRLIAERADVPHHVLNLGDYGRLAASGLTQPGVALNEQNVIVPGRNAMLLAAAGARAAVLGADAIFFGACGADQRGFPDCRPTFVRSMEQTLRIGLDRPRLVIHTPLLDITKAETFKLAATMPECWSALRLTVTCYNGLTEGCGTCPSCVARSQGLEAAGLKL